LVDLLNLSAIYLRSFGDSFRGRKKSFKVSWALFSDSIYIQELAVAAGS
jgi:hypothetical protein